MAGEYSNPRDQAIFEKIAEMISEQLGCEKDEITPTSHIIDDLGADSLDRAELIVSIEETFFNYDFELTDEQAEEIQTVDDAATFVHYHSWWQP